MKRLVLPWACLCTLLWALSISGALAQTDPALREDGVLYFDGNVPDKVMATFKAATTVYSRRDFQLVVAGFGAGDQVELLGMSPEGYLVKGTYRNNTVTGWIHPEDLPTGFDVSVFALAKKNQARRDAVAVAIANKSVIQGMTPDEVQQAVGKPEQTASKTDASGSILTWIFTTYKEEPQYSYGFDAFGRAQLQTYYVRIPIGQLIVNFDNNNEVTSVEQHTTDPNSPGVVTN